MAKVSLSQIRQFINSLPEAVFVGIDVHKKTYHMAFFRPNQGSIAWSTPADAKTAVQTLKQLPVPVARVCYEAGPCGFDLARRLKKANIPCIVAAPSKIYRPVCAGNKTDRLDCIKLAEHLAAGMIRGVAVPSEEQEAMQGISRRREDLIRFARTEKQRIKSLLLQYNTDEPKGPSSWSNASLDALKNLRVNSY